MIIDSVLPVHCVCWSPDEHVCAPTRAPMNAANNRSHIKPIHMRCDMLRRTNRLLCKSITDYFLVCCHTAQATHNGV